MERIRNLVRSAMGAVARGLDKATGGKLSPNAVTLFGLFMHIPIALLIASGDYTFGALLLIVFGLFDTLDGQLARLQNRTTQFGMFLDSVTDRTKEVLIYTGLAYSFVALHESTLAIWAVAACGISLLISYTNAWGEAVTSGTKTHQTNKRFRAGIMSFDVRMVVLVVALLADKLAIGLIIIVGLGVITVIERVMIVKGRLR